MASLVYTVCMKLCKLRSKRLVKWRLERGWSRETLARRVGLSKSAIDKYEQGDREVPLVVALAIAALGSGLSPVGEGEDV